MASPSITLKDSANADVIFNLQSVVGTKATYIDASSNTTSPRLLIVNVDSKKPGAKGSDRAQVLYQSIKIDTVTGASVVLSDQSGRTRPRTTLFSAKEQLDAAAFVKNYRLLSGVEDAFDEGRVL